MDHSQQKLKASEMTALSASLQCWEYIDIYIYIRATPGQIYIIYIYIYIIYIYTHYV